MTDFHGPVYHSDGHKSAAPSKGKRVVVIGACNSGADMCQDFVAKGAAEVTMVQRSATCVLSARSAETLLFRPGYPAHYTAARRGPGEQFDSAGAGTRARAWDHAATEGDGPGNAGWFGEGGDEAEVGGHP
ncbi:hypothetical protein MIND_00387600 [Mycena indigotica]|uniref:Flavin-containing monooxygenase n=1 Tax=Mycena indigotica TaxID=2126181 RepID=A0A8H6W9W9_9AGAR|nr:uncharacterized protein MIND_00387600 [Mycena indigotica]KAF7310142.1 hypothetical protein MIND_00387600 [Mycena indigotica]